MENKGQLRKVVPLLLKKGRSNILRTSLFKYPGVHLGSRLVWKDKIKPTRMQLNIKTG